MNKEDYSYKYKIKNNYNILSNSEKKVGDYVLINGYNIINMSLLTLSNKIGVSEPTIIRFVKKIGFKGYIEFKLKLTKEWGSEFAETESKSNLLIDLHVNKDDKLEDVPQKMIGLTIKALEDTLKIMDIEELRKAVEFIGKSRIVDIYGVGNSGSVGSDLMNKLSRIGIICRMHADNHVQQINARHLTRYDVAIGISHSGNTIDTVNALKLAKEVGCKTIALTNFRGTEISRYADVVLNTGDIESTFYSETMVSRISQLAIIDILYMGILLGDYEKFASRLDKINVLVKDKNF